MAQTSPIDGAHQRTDVCRDKVPLLALTAHIDVRRTA
jgi:hypothetical protein